MKVYIVLDEYQADMEYSASILGVFYDLKAATDRMKKERDERLLTSYNGVSTVTIESSSSIYLAGVFGEKWHRIRIVEKDVDDKVDDNTLLCRFLEACYPGYWSSAYMAWIDDCYKELDGECDELQYASAKECMDELERMTGIVVKQALDVYFERLRKKYKL